MSGHEPARKLSDFLSSATTSGGYYIGRYEAGNASNTLVCKAGQTVYVNASQSDASTACKNMYNNGLDGYSAGTFSSDLINSYAWDTAIVFIRNFGGESASNYANKNPNHVFLATGEQGDEFCNINDMSGNAMEFTTEATDDEAVPTIARSGYFYAGPDEAFGSTCARSEDSGTGDSFRSFRPILYVA